MKHEIIDDFLPKENFKGLYNLVLSSHKFAWFYNQSVATTKDKDKSHIYFSHVFYDESVPYSDHFKELHIVWKALEKNNHKLKGLLRSKANLYPKTPELIIHEMHKDFPFEHKGGLLSLNTCDGYTLLEDGTKVDSVANRMLIFDASKKHASTTCTNKNARININFNFF